MIRIALHPRDPHQALEEQKEMIRELKEQGYTILSYQDLIVARSCIIVQHPPGTWQTSGKFRLKLSTLDRFHLLFEDTKVVMRMRT
jgi:hypothetical protein